MLRGEDKALGKSREGDEGEGCVLQGVEWGKTALQPKYTICHQFKSTGDLSQTAHS